MTDAGPVDLDAEPFLKTVETAGVIAGLVGAVALVVGGWLGVVTMLATEPGRFDGETHPTLGIGTAVTVVSIAVALLGALFAWVALSYARPRLATVANVKHEQQHRAQLDAYVAARNAEGRRR